MTKKGPMKQAIALSFLLHVFIVTAAGLNIPPSAVEHMPKTVPVILEIPQDYKELPHNYIRAQEHKIRKSISSEQKKSKNGTNPVTDDQQKNNISEMSLLRYHEIIKQKIEDMRIYPSNARHRRIEGAVHVNFSLTSSGELNSIAIKKSSGSPTLDNAALEAVKNAAPFPPYNDFCNKETLLMDVVIIYTL